MNRLLMFVFGRKAVKSEARLPKYTQSDHFFVLLFSVGLCSERT